MRLLAAISLAATLAVTLPVAACSPGATAPRGSALAVRVEAAGLRLENLTDERLFYAVVDREALALVDLNFCNANPDACPNRVEPRAAVTVPYDRVIGYGPQSRELVVHHWHLRPPVTAAGYQAYQYEPLIVTLR